MAHPQDSQSSNPDTNDRKYSFLYSEYKKMLNETLNNKSTVNTNEDSFNNTAKKLSHQKQRVQSQQLQAQWTTQVPGQRLDLKQKLEAQRGQFPREARLSQREGDSGSGAHSNNKSGSSYKKKLQIPELNLQEDNNILHENLVEDVMNTSMGSENYAATNQEGRSTDNKRAGRVEGASAQDAKQANMTTSNGNNMEPEDNLKEIRDYESRLRESEGKDTNKSSKKVRFHGMQPEQLLDAQLPQAELELLRAEEQMRVLEQSATFIQKMWRGYLTRSVLRYYLQQLILHDEENKEEPQQAATETDEDHKDSTELLHTEDLNMYNEEHMVEMM